MDTLVGGGGVIGSNSSLSLSALRHSRAKARAIQQAEEQAREDARADVEQSDVLGPRARKRRAWRRSDDAYYRATSPSGDGIEMEEVSAVGGGIGNTGGDGDGDEDEDEDEDENESVDELDLSRKASKKRMELVEKERQAIGFVGMEGGLPSEQEVADAMSVGTFVFPRFWKELLVHMFFPLSIPYILIVDGWRGMTNRTFVDVPGLVLFGQWGESISVFVCLGLMALHWHEFVSFGATIDILSLVIMHIFRSTLVAVKHGWRKPSLVAAFEKTTLPRSVLSTDEIISGWITLSGTQIKQELRFAAVRQDLNIHSGLSAILYGQTLSTAFNSLSTALSLSPELASSITYVDNNGDPISSDDQDRVGNVCVPYKALLLNVVGQDANARIPRTTFAMRIFVSLIIAFALPIARLILRPGQNPFGDSVALQVATILVCGIMFGVTFNFSSLILFAGFADANRRTRWMKLWGDYLFSHTSPFSAYFMENPSAWLLGRRTLMDIGHGFRRRLDVFFGALLLIIAFSIIPLGILSLRDDRADWVNLFFALVLVLTVLITSGLAITTTAGYSTNKTFTNDAYRLHTRALDPISTLNGRLTLFNLTLRGLEFDSEALALTLLGLPLGPATYKTLLSLALFLISVSLRQLFFE